MKKKILLVEDQPTIQKLLHFMLSKDYDITIAGNGYEAILWLESRQMPDLIIMDWVMPYMDGRSFLKSIKVSGFYSEIPVIVLSASEDLETELSNLRYPVDKFLQKPFDPVNLKKAIADIFKVNSHGFVN